MTNDLSVTSVTISGQAPAIGATSQYSAKATLSDGNSVDVTTRSSWQSSNTGVLTVSNSGLAGGVTAGAAELTATYQNVVGRLKVDVAAQPCLIALSSEHLTIPASGGTGTVALSVPSACAWRIVNDSSFITIASGSSGTGSAQISYAVAPNAGETRQATIRIVTSSSQLSLAFSQAAAQPAGCAFAVSPAVLDFGEQASTRMVAVTVTQGVGCSWNATTDGDFIRFPNGASGVGTGQLAVSVTANTTPVFRNATVTVAGFPIRVIQNIPYCVTGLSPQTVTVPAAGGSATVNVSALIPNCSWVAVGNPSWITFTSDPWAAGNGQLHLQVFPNTGAARQATIPVGQGAHGDQVLTVIQERGEGTPGPCTFSVSPNVLDFGEQGGTRSLSVTMTQGSDCKWSATTDGGFVSFPSGASGTGTGQLAVSVTPNTTPAFRNATVSVAGTTVKVIQNIPYCVTALSPASITVPASGGTGTVNVSALIPNCSWVAVDIPSWITFAPEPWGSGNGQIRYQVAPNTGAARQAAIPVGQGGHRDQVLVIVQERGGQ